MNIVNIEQDIERYRADIERLQFLIDINTDKARQVYQQSLESCQERLEWLENVLITNGTGE